MNASLQSALTGLLNTETFGDADLSAMSEASFANTVYNTPFTTEMTDFAEDYVSLAQSMFNFNKLA